MGLAATAARMMKRAAVIVTPAAQHDEYGDLTATGAEERILVYVGVGFGRPAEFTGEGQVSTLDWTVYAPADAAIAATSRIELDGGQLVLEVTGPPAPYRSLRTDEPAYQVVPCRVVT